MSDYTPPAGGGGGGGGSAPLVTTNYVIAGSATKVENGPPSFHVGGDQGVAGWAEFFVNGIEKSSGSGFTVNLRGDDPFLVSTNSGNQRLLINSVAASFGVPVGSSGRTFAQLPAAPALGMMATVTDSTVNTWGSVIAGGGANKVLAFYNGTAWTVYGK